jgi:hypothetical protein
VTFKGGGFYKTDSRNGSSSSSAANSSGGTSGDSGSGSGSGSGSNPEEELREAFEVFDTDRDGRISAEELLRVFRAIGDERCTLEECRRMIAGVDKNRDGFVCFEEFSVMMELQR